MAVGERVRKVNFKHALISGGVVAVMFTLFAIICQIAPYGDNTFLMYDMKRQYVDYYAYYESILRGENNIFYSFSTTLGAGMMGFYAYYMTSPFLVVLSLVPKAYLPIGITVVIAFKLVMAAILMDLFFQYYIEVEKTEFDAVSLGAVSWAFSGFLIAHSMNTMWIDVVILVPVMIVALDCMLIDDRKLPFIITLTAMLLLNYYITYQVIIFIIIWSGMRIYELREHGVLRKLENLIISGILGAGIAGVLLIPTFIELSNSPKDITRLGLKAEGMRLSLVDIMSKTPTMAYDYIEARSGYPQIYCGVLLLILCVLFFLNKKNDLRQRLSILFMLVLFFISFEFDEVNLVWHAGMEPSGHPYRQAFLVTFIIIIGATVELRRLRDEKLKLTMLTCGLVAINMINVLRPRYDHVTTVMIWVNVGLVAVYTLLMLTVGLSRNKEKISRMAIMLMMAIQMCELLVNAGYTYKWQSMLETTQSDYQASVNKVLEVKSVLDAKDSGFYRMENLTPRQQNDSMQFEYNGITHYSSAGLMNVREFMQEMGYNDTGLYTDYGHNNTITADTILGVKYVLSDGSIAAQDEYELIADGGVKAYKNPYALGVAVGTDNANFDNTHINVNNPFELQEDIIGRLSGSRADIFVEADAEYKDYYDENWNLNRLYTLTAKCDGQMYMYLGELIGTTQDLTVFLENEMLSTYGNAACISVLKLGYYEKGETVDLLIKGSRDVVDFGVGHFVTENVDSISRAYEKINTQQTTVSKKSSSHLEITTEGDGVFVSVPWEEDWHVTVDGKVQYPQMIYDTLMYIPLGSEGEHIINMYYVPTGFIFGMVVSILSIAITVFIAKHEKK